MNRTELARALSVQTGTSLKQASETLAALFGDSSGGGLIVNTLKGGDSISLVGFGTFSVRERAARTGRNPQTGAAIQISASKNIHLKAGTKVRELLNS